MLKIQEFFKRIVEIDKEGQKEPNPEKPFEKQYIAREQLSDLIPTLNFAEFPPEFPKSIKTALEGYIHYRTAVNFYDTEEQSECYLSIFDSLFCLGLFQKLDLNFMEQEQSTDQIRVKKDEALKKFIHWLDESNENFSSILEIIQNHNPHFKSLFSNVGQMDEQIIQNFCVPLLLGIIDCMNYLGIVWCNRQSNDESLKALHTAQKLHKSFTKSFEIHENSTKILNFWKEGSLQVQTMIHFFLAQVYGLMKDTPEAAKHCYITLVQQLKGTNPQTRASNSQFFWVSKNFDFDGIEWVKNCVSLAAIFYSSNDFSKADYCLKAASMVLAMERKRSSKLNENKASAEEVKPEMSNELQGIEGLKQIEEKTPQTQEPKETKETESEKFDEIEATIQITWGKLHLYLLKESGKRLHSQNDEEKDEFEANLEDIDSENKKKSSSPANKSIIVPTMQFFSNENEDFKFSFDFPDERFSDFDETEKTIFKNQISETLKLKDFNYATTFEEAREIFRAGKQNFENATKFFVLDGFVTSHINILQDISSLFHALIPFEKEPARVIAMHQKRISILSPFLNELNPQYYLQLLLQLGYECVETQYGVFEHFVHHFPSELKKIHYNHSLVVQFADDFVKLIKKNKLGFPENLEEESKPVFIRVKIILAQTLYKISQISQIWQIKPTNPVFPNPNDDLKEIRIESCKRALREFQFIKKYVQSEEMTNGLLTSLRTVSPNSSILQEIDFALQMCDLLPQKLDEMAFLNK